MKALHDLDIQGLQGVAGWLNEEDAGMDAVVHNVDTVDLIFSIEVGIKALLDVVDNWTPRFVVVHKITKARGIDNSQPQADTSLLNIGADRLDSDGLRDDVEAGSLALLGWVKRGVEESVDKGRLSKSRFTCTCNGSARVSATRPRTRGLLTNNHHIEVEALPDTLAVPLIR